MAIVKWVNNTRPPEREAGLAARMRMVIKAYGGAYRFAQRFDIPYSTVKGWRRIPHTVVPQIHRDYPRIFTAAFCRPDLNWNKFGDLVSGSRMRRKLYS